jgi:hypothetical protein
MSALVPCPQPHSSRRGVSAVLIAVILFAVSLATACGSGAKSGAAPTLSGNTEVTVVLTSTANDQLSQFYLDFQGITLTSKSGKVVTLLSSSQPAELIHLNGGIEPLFTVTVPQDIYTAASAVIGGATFTCVTLTPSGGLDTSTYAYGQTPNSNVTVSLPQPLTITGSSLALSLDLLVSQSASYSTCYPANGISTWSITPTFNLAPLTISPQATNPENGKVTDLYGDVTALDAASGSLTLSLPESTTEEARTLSVSTTTNTVYQGVSDFSVLAIGTLVVVDGVVQPGSLTATRIAVEDPSAVDVLSGPVVQLSSSQPAIAEPGAAFFTRQSLGRDRAVVIGSYGTQGTAFQISGRFNNLQSLPFVPSFSGSNMVPGQNVYLSSLTTFPTDAIYPPATTITLMPQTIDGTVTGASTSGNFAVYTVSLAPYDLFPTLAVQPWPPTVLPNPSQVEVYVDSNTQLLNAQALAPGQTLRFYGLVFNDNGTLRMDCAQVNDGVDLSPQPSAVQQSHMEKGYARRIQSQGVGPLQRTITVITREPER